MALKHIAAVALLAATAPAAQAATPFYLGAWRVESAVVAPWADLARPLDPAEHRALVGRLVTVTPTRITGPGNLACRAAHPALSDSTADMLFQGELGEPQSANPKRSAQAMAEALGFVGHSWKTMDTGCDLDWHFADRTTAKIGLNDYVYTLKKP